MHQAIWGIVTGGYSSSSIEGKYKRGRGRGREERDKNRLGEVIGIDSVESRGSAMMG